MSKLRLACGLTVAIAIVIAMASYAPDAAAVKVTRDPNPPRRLLWCLSLRGRLNQRQRPISPR